jgi:hypothetical protein
MGTSDRGFKALARATVIRTRALDSVITSRTTGDIDADASPVTDVVKRRAIADLVKKLEDGAVGAASVKTAAAAASLERRRSHVTRLLRYAGTEPQVGLSRLPGGQLAGIVADAAARKSIAGRLTDTVLGQLLLPGPLLAAEAAGSSSESHWPEHGPRRQPGRL